MSSILLPSAEQIDLIINKIGGGGFDLIKEQTVSSSTALASGESVDLLEYNTRNKYKNLIFIGRTVEAGQCEITVKYRVGNLECYSTIAYSGASEKIGFSIPLIGNEYSINFKNITSNQSVKIARFRIMGVA